MINQRIVSILESLESILPLMPPTQLYNEGWMLRLTLDRFASLNLNREQHVLAVSPGCRWYSEAYLPSAFLARWKGDPLAESWTHADGVIGHFDIGTGAKGDLTLRTEARHFVVLEAKMYSKLALDVKNAPYYNQAARSAACIAEVLRRAGRPAEEFDALGFYVLAPESMISLGLIEKLLVKDSIHNLVELRVKAYEDELYKSLTEWFSEWFEPVLDRLDIKAISWEKLIGFLEPNNADLNPLNDFYHRCLKFG